MRHWNLWNNEIMKSEKHDKPDWRQEREWAAHHNLTEGKNLHPEKVKNQDSDWLLACFIDLPTSKQLAKGCSSDSLRHSLFRTSTWGARDSKAPGLPPPSAWAMALLGSEIYISTQGVSGTAEGETIFRVSFGSTGDSAMAPEWLSGFADLA